MSDRPTPETDATAEKNIYGVACKVDVDFARKLERERDEALAWISEIFRLLGLPEGDMGALENFRRERDKGWKQEGERLPFSWKRGAESLAEETLP